MPKNIDITMLFKSHYKQYASLRSMLNLKFGRQMY